MSPEGIDPQEAVYGDNYKPKRKKDHPTPQPSGRTAEEIIIAAFSKDDEEEVFNLEKCERQLFDALLEIVGKDEKKPGRYPKTVHAYQQRNRVRAELRERLRVFFGQPEENGKKYGEVKFDEFNELPDIEKPALSGEDTNKKFLAQPPIFDLNKDQPEASGKDGDAS